MQIKSRQRHRVLPSISLISILLLLLSSTACVSLGLQQGAGAEKSPLPNSWQLRGKLASRGMGAASFTWQQTGKNNIISISAPLGAGAARIEYIKGQISVNTGSEQLSHDDAVRWLQLQGLAVPFDALAWWVQGLPVPRLARQRSTDGRSFEQAGWKVTVRKLVTVDCRQLPSRLHIENGETLLKLGGLKWQWRELGTEEGPTLFGGQQLAECTDG